MLLSERAQPLLPVGGREKPLLCRSVRGEEPLIEQAEMRVELSDSLWARTAPLLEKPQAQSKGPAACERLTLHGGYPVGPAQWRDLPDPDSSYATTWRPPGGGIARISRLRSGARS